jgi:hypothetical protein
VAVKNVSIQTASVEIRVVKVDNHKMTLSVYDQIEQEQIFNRDGSLKGKPLGYVNRHGSEEIMAEYRHRHIIWQKDGELRKTIVYDFDELVGDMVSRKNNIDVFGGSFRRKYVEDKMIPHAGLAGIIWFEETGKFLQEVDDSYFAKKKTQETGEIVYKDTKIKEEVLRGRSERLTTYKQGVAMCWAVAQVYIAI